MVSKRKENQEIMIELKTSNEAEKPDVEFIENVDTTASSINNVAPDDTDFSDIDEAKVLRKIDWHLLPIVTILYLLAFLDRGNIGNAKIEGLLEDLHLSNTQYNLCLTIFFITYSIFEIPSNMMLKKIGRQSIFLPAIMLVWGIIMTLMGVVKDFKGLFATRFFLGIAESGLYPGVSFGLTMYYCKAEMQSRQAIFYGAASVAGAFSGLLAFGIAKMSGVGGYGGWRWIFILEGLLTVIVAFITFFVMPDYPDTAKFLTPRERQYVIWRLRNDANVSPSRDDDEFKIRRPDFSKFDDSNDYGLLKSLKIAALDFQIYLQFLLYIGNISPNYSISMFLPSVVKSLGYTNSKAQLMTVPIYVTAAIVSVIQAFGSDKVGLRSPFIAFNMVLAITGFTMAIVGQETGQPNVIYGGVYVAIIGLSSGFPGIVSWLSNNLANSRKRAIGMAIQIGIGNFGGACASNFYKGTAYTLGHSVALGFAVMGVFSCVCLVLSYDYLNKKRLKDLKDGKYDEYSDEMFFRMGDKSPHYVYKL